MSLQDWLSSGWLVEHQPSVEEIHDLLGVAALVAELDAYRKKRNIGGYERAGLVSDLEAVEMHSLAVKLRRDAEAWLRAHHPELL